MPTTVRPAHWSRTTLALRRLAASLVDGHKQREDLVRSTLVAAFERPPRVLSWSWLASALRKRARDLGPARLRRGRAEELPLLASPTPDAAEIAQRLELQEELSRALRALGEPYQSTLYLRFFEDRTPSEIARRSGQADESSSVQSSHCSGGGATASSRGDVRCFGPYSRLMGLGTVPTAPA